MLNNLLNCKYKFKNLSYYIPVLIKNIFFFFWFDDLLSFFVILLNLNISQSKALVLYDAEWLTARKRFYLEFAYLKSKCWIPLFAIFCGGFNIFLGYGTKLLYFNKPYDLATYECVSTDLYNSICKSILSGHLVTCFTGYYLIFFGIFAVLIPLINQTYKLSFKKLFFLCIILLEASMYFLAESIDLERGLRDIWWTEYIPFNYWYGNEVSLAVSYITLSFFFITVSYLVIALIFIYNIFFKKSKFLFFIDRIKSCFLFLFFCFLLFRISIDFIYNSALLCSYSERSKLIISSVTPDTRYVIDGQIVFNVCYSEIGVVLAILPIFVFLLNSQFSKINFKNYWKFVVGVVLAWFLLILGTLILWAVLKNLIKFSSTFESNIRLFFFLCCFVLLFYSLIKYLFLGVSINAITVSIFMFLILFFLGSYCIFCDPILKKYQIALKLFEIRDLSSLILEESISEQEVFLFRLFFCWPVIGFFHWYIEYFPKIKLNAKLVVAEFCLFFYSCFPVIIFSVRLIVSDLHVPFIFIGLTQNEFSNYSYVDSYWLRLSDFAYQFIFIGFAWFIFTVFFLYLYSKIKKN